MRYSLIILKEDRREKPLLRSRCRRFVSRKVPALAKRRLAAQYGDHELNISSTRGGGGGARGRYV